MLKRLLQFICIFLSLAFANVSANEPQEVVENLHTKLLDNMQNSATLGFQGRYNNIKPIIEASFDFPKIAQVILSRSWSGLSQENQQQFIDKVRLLTIATYASRFNEFTNEEFRTESINDLKKGRKLIRTLVVSGNESDKLEYLVHPVDGSWLIISVIANGVNDLSLKRAEYSAVIKERGFDGLISEIDQKISEMESS